MIKLHDLLPPNFKSDARIRAFCEAMDKSTAFMEKQFENLLLYHNLDNLPESVIDMMADDLHVDFYDQSLDIDTKKELVRCWATIHRKKGTKGAVLDIVRVLLPDAVVKEWFEHAGHPYFFKVVTCEIIKTEKVFDNVFKAIGAAKNVRSWLYALCVYRERRQSLFFGFAVMTAHTHKLKQVVRPPNSGAGTLFLGNAVYSYKARNYRQKTAVISGQHNLRSAMCVYSFKNRHFIVKE